MAPPARRPLTEVNAIVRGTPTARRTAPVKPDRLANADRPTTLLGQQGAAHDQAGRPDHHEGGTMKVCRACNQYTLKSLCPKCGQPTVNPYGSASTHKRGSTLTEKELMWWVKERDRKVVSPTSYALAHTLGRCKFQPHGGDGAYSAWLHQHFSSHSAPQGCVLVDRLNYTGKGTQLKAVELVEEFNPLFVAEFKRFLQLPGLVKTSTIILNWHVRFTGRPNAWTGNGINKLLMGMLQELAEAMGKRLLIVYTVHEYTDLRQSLVSPTALVSLNPDVDRGLTLDFGPRLPSNLSRVPGLTTSLHTTSVDLIMQYLGELQAMDRQTQLTSSSMVSTPVVHRSEGVASHSFISALLLQELRARNGYGVHPLLRGVKGILIFGMITGRHGTTVENVTNLCVALNIANAPEDFRVVIAGKTTDKDLEGNLKKLANTVKCKRLLFAGEINSFDDVAGLKYAISFDEHGFRTNASAMVNAIRAGGILFCRIGSESDKDLISRCVAKVGKCEERSANYMIQLMRQQPRFRETRPAQVGIALDQFFRQVTVTTGAKTEDTGPRIEEF